MSTAALLACAVASGAASAKLPEWGQCRPTSSGSGGKYANAGCTQQVRKVYGSLPGGFEWYPLTRSETEIKEHASAKLVFNSGEGEQPDKLVTFRFAGGHEVQCPGGLKAENGKVLLDGAAPLLEFAECEEPALALENHGETGEGGNYPGNCQSFDAEYIGGIATTKEWENGRREDGETTWIGQTVFLSSKTSSTPRVGISYRAAPNKERFLQQIVCESGEDSQPLSIQIGGHKRSERIVAEVTPVNAMSEAHAVTVRSQGVEALINTGSFQPVEIEASMFFPTTSIPYEQRLAWEEGLYGERNERYENELELKATP